MRGITHKKKEMSMKKFTVILPLFDNEGHSLQWEIRTILDTIATQAGGVTALNAQGIWFDEYNARITDTSLFVFTFCDAPTAVRLQGYCKQWVHLLKQKSLLSTIESCADTQVIFTEGE
jgi:hypothetical protein